MTKLLIPKKVKKAIELYQDNPIFYRAITVHRTHQGKKLNFKDSPYLVDIYKDKSPEMCIVKSTQCGISEYLICRSMYRSSIGKSLFYVLPTFDIKNIYVKERVNKTITNTPFYSRLKVDYKKYFIESLSLQQIGSGVILFTGSNTPNAFISFPADDVIIDEYDFCDQANLEMAWERQSASEDKTTVFVGNPSIVNFGVDAKYSRSDKKIWITTCSSCGKRIHPDFFDHVVMEVDEGRWAVRDTSYNRDSGKDLNAICDKCGKPFHRFNEGEWVKQVTSQVDISGRHVSKMFSTNVTVAELLTRFEAGLNSDSAMQRFYNGDLGKAFTPKGSMIDRQMLEDCKGDYLMLNSSTRPCVAGIDVGSINNIMVSEVMADDRLKVVYIGEVREEPEIYDVLRRFNVMMFVIDAQPEMRMSKRICTSTRRGFMSFYVAGKTDLTFIPKTRAVNSNRTMSLDAVKENLVLQNVILPANAENVPSFYEQLTSSTRVFDEDRQVFDWLCGSGEDHYFHAFAYMLLAKRLLIMSRR